KVWDAQTGQEDNGLTGRDDPLRVPAGYETSAPRDVTDQKLRVLRSESPLRGFKRNGSRCSSPQSRVRSPTSDVASAVPGTSLSTGCSWRHLPVGVHPRGREFAVSSLPTQT